MDREGGEKPAGKAGSAVRLSSLAERRAGPTSRPRDLPTSKIVDAVLVLCLGVIVAVLGVCAWELLDVFTLPLAPLLGIVAALLLAVPAATAAGAVLRWRWMGRGRALGWLALVVLLGGAVELGLFAGGIPVRVRFAASVGAMDDAAEALIAEHGDAPRPVRVVGPVDIGWLTMASFEVLSCGSEYSIGGSSPSDDPGVLFADGFDRRLLYCRNHNGTLEIPADVEAYRDTDMTHLGGNWYVVTEDF